MHLNGAAPPNKEAVKANMKRFLDLGVRVYITEFDVNLKHVTGTQEERLNIQAGIYRDMLDSLLESGGHGFCVFGIGDEYSWLQGPVKPDIGSFVNSAPNANPTPFDDNLNPKPAYYAMLDVLKNSVEAR
jgi:endo-1,4-beta-xylanase